MHRRTFFEHLGAASAAGMLARIPSGARWRACPNDVLIDPDENEVRAFALQAIDVARKAGASFADVRVYSTWKLTVVAGYVQGEEEGGRKPSVYPPARGLRIGYGIRAIVGNAWGFASGSELTPDAVARAARDAVESARGNRALRPHPLDLAPVAGGLVARWETPIERDPLLVPVTDQCQLGLETVAAVMEAPEIVKVNFGTTWRRAISVFAATDGRCLTQILHMAQPAVGAAASVGPAATDGAGKGLETIRMGALGYEAIREKTIVGEARELGKRTVELANAARHATSAEVGRYDLVFGAGAVAGLLQETLVSSLNLPRALGYFADEGTSFAAPPAEILGQYQVASSLFTLRGDRTRPAGGATAKWDEEGVETHDYTFVQDGTIVDYHTDRETAVALADWYRSRNLPLRSHACLRRGGDMIPTVQVPNVTMAPGKAAADIGDLIKDVKRGFYLEAGGDGGTDQQYITAQHSPPHYTAREIRRGVLGGYVKELGFHFTTTPFWKSVDAIGGAASARVMSVGSDLEEFYDPMQIFPMSTYETVPMRARNVNVINVGRSA